MVLLNAEKLAEVRRRLSDISWWMRCTAETIARQANKEDLTTGRFWQGRHWAQLLIDKASILACADYVDLNPVRAALADRPENSDFTGAKDRIDDFQNRSLARTIKAIRYCLRNLNKQATASNNLSQRLTQGVVQKYNNSTDKRARHRHKNSDKKPLGDPKITPIDNQIRQAIKHQAAKMEARFCFTALPVGVR